MTGVHESLNASAGWLFFRQERIEHDVVQNQFFAGQGGGVGEDKCRFGLCRLEDDVMEIDARHIVVVGVAAFLAFVDVNP